jgi:hypothetical protein
VFTDERDADAEEETERDGDRHVSDRLGRDRRGGNVGVRKHARARELVEIREHLELVELLLQEDALLLCNPELG